MVGVRYFIAFVKLLANFVVWQIIPILYVKNTKHSVTNGSPIMPTKLWKKLYGTKHPMPLTDKNSKLNGIKNVRKDKNPSGHGILKQYQIHLKFGQTQ